MKLYRIVKHSARASDFSGIGAFRAGGRWNSKGTYMLYTSENSSLAYLESLVHFDKSLMPPKLFITELEIEEAATVYVFPYISYPADWMKLGVNKNQLLGDQWMKDLKYLAVKVRSAINIAEHNYLLNPLFPRYNDFIKLISVTEIEVDGRL